VLLDHAADVLGVVQVQGGVHLVQDVQGGGLEPKGGGGGRERVQGRQIGSVKTKLRLERIQVQMSSVCC
jgi:hypothetical protein